EPYALYARIFEGGREVREFSALVTDAARKDGRMTIAKKWKPEKLWDIHTPQNMLELRLSLGGANPRNDEAPYDSILPIRFGFREFWIDGRDFYLNGSRIYLSCVPYDNAAVSAAAATYEG